MSKSLGNVIEPEKVMATLGADVLRLWIAATDYANEMSALGRDPQAHVGIVSAHAQHRALPAGQPRGFRSGHAMRCPIGELVAIDRWAIARTAALQEEIAEAYRNYQYHLIYQKVHNFCVEDLGGFYLDLLKDRLYTTPRKGRGAPLGADRAVSHRREHGALARAHPFFYGRRDLELHARQAQRVGVPRDLARVAQGRCRTRSTGTSSSS